MLEIPLMDGNITRQDVDCLISFLQTTGRFTQGAKVREFEDSWSSWLGVKHSVFVNSGSSANMITMAAIRERYGVGEVIVPAITWSSDISSILIAGMKPVLLDVQLNNLAMAEEEILAHITKNTRAVFLSHILGYNGLTTSLIEELKIHNIPLIEDVCESHGAEYLDCNGVLKKCGTAGLMSNFSFYYAHHMSTIEGGMVCTDDDELYQLLRMFRSHGMLREVDDPFYRATIESQYSALNPEFLFVVPGFNMRSTELNAVIGINQLKKLDSNIMQRRKNYATFIHSLDSNIYYTDFDSDGSSNYAFVVLLREASKQGYQKLTDLLRREHVEFRRGTAGGGNQVRQPFVRKYVPGIRPEDYPNAERIHEFGLYVGNYPSLQENKILELCHLLNNAY